MHKNEKTIPKRIFVFIVIAGVIAILKACFSVPITVEYSDEYKCADINTRVSMPEYFSQNRRTSCQQYKVDTGRYIMENILCFLFVLLVLHLGDHLINFRKYERERNLQAEPKAPNTKKKSPKKKSE